MNKRENFTAERVATFKCEEGKQQSIYWDGKTPSLGLRVTVSGAKAYIFESRLHGKTIRLTIGNPDVWPLETQWRTDSATGERIEFQRGARQEAARLRTLTDQGIDPRDEKAEKRTKAETAAAAAKQKAVLALDIWSDYIKARKAHWGRSMPKRTMK
ncbi:Arm DNA-binding domain-containing protein [Dechloromonas sp. HYN0024]|uniref:Arm DNA-binding domain-containing protein n=1 Tax=Dechloromonas sp. HYN0024 TaxID=2231055 RepID=UPI001F07CC22|nr:Arm DNA-binding domain-containing protein [Dechloromonas sp. HYN0024]